MTERPDPWDDARLAAAFTARASRTAETPAELADAVVAAIERRRARRASSARPWIAAAAAVVALVGFAGVRILTQGDRPGRASSSPGAASASPAVEILPITVGDALTVRASGSDRELVVSGFLSPMPVMACPFIPAGLNPTRIHCPQTFQWLMERPEALMATSPGSATGGPPTGPAFHPSFALVDPPDVPIPGRGLAQPLPVMLVGHFHDRRALLCEANPPPETPCGDVFVVDRVAAIDGASQAVATRLDNVRFDDASQVQVTEQPRDLVADVDQLAIEAVPGGSILSRQLVTINRVIGIEPILAHDDVIPHMGNPATLMWIVTVLDAHANPPIARTFALIDSSNWFAEVTSTGAVMHERLATGPSPKPPAVVPSADPTAFDTAPTTVLGLDVRDVASVVEQRRSGPSLDSSTNRDEIAIRAWYVGPDPNTPCSGPEAAIHAPTPPCDEGRRWLLDHPEAYGTEVGQLRRDPEPWPRALNPALPVDVPFDVPATWMGEAVVPQPVVVIGHFNDMRGVNTYAGDLFFVIDALAWTRDRSIQSLDSVTRLSTAGTEDPAAVLARIDSLAGTTAVATWATLVDAVDFAALDPRAAETMPEFTSGPPVWVVRRLIENEMDGRQRLAVEWAFTADGGRRAWISPAPDAQPDLATTIDLRDLDARTDLVRVFDYGGQIVSARPVTARDRLEWRYTVHKYTAFVEVARGRTDREVAIRWTSGACNREWRILVSARTDAPGVFVQPRTYGDDCPEHPRKVSIIIEFDHAVDLDAVRTTDEAVSSGG
jgi:hypothetical protein